MTSTLRDPVERVRTGAALSHLVRRALRGLALCGLAVSCSDTRSNATQGRPNVLLYIVDTLRADGLGAYGAGTSRTPNVDALAARGTLFEAAHANSSWTRPGVGSLLTGLYPTRHGAQRRNHMLSADATTLATMLRERGYTTALVTANPNVSTFFGFGTGFDVQSEMFGRETAGAVGPEEMTTPSDEVTTRVLEHVDGMEGPWFCAVLTIDPHAPHHPPPPFAPPPPTGDAAGTDGSIDTILKRIKNEAQRDYVRELYAAEIAFNDDSFGALLTGLEERGELDNTLIVFASDHGEEFWEYGRRQGHGESLSEEVTSIPLVFAGPEVEAGRRIALPVEQVDVAPTVLSLLGLAVPEGLDGRALLGAWANGGANELDPRALYATLNIGRKRFRSVTEYPWKFVWDEKRNNDWIYDLRLGEAEPVATSLDPDPPASPEVAEAMHRLRKLLAALTKLDGVPGSSVGELDPAVERSLRALGYVK